MFTGLIERLGKVRLVERRAMGLSLALEVDEPFDSELELGESVAVNGVCLTVTSRSGVRFTVDVSAESLDKTALKHIKVNDSVHLERALQLGGRLGGHIVTGHVDAVGHLLRIEPLGMSKRLWFEAPEAVSRYLVQKGSVAIDGASLTVNEVSPAASGAQFSVVLIPHSQEKLLLTQKHAGAEVNLEGDILGKYVERLLGPRAQASKGGVTLETLVKAGWM